MFMGSKYTHKAKRGYGMEWESEGNKNFVWIQEEGRRRRRIKKGMRCEEKD